MSVNFKPLFDKILIEVKTSEQKTSGGIIIPDSAKEKPQVGCVIAVGTGKEDEPMILKPGEEVLFGKFSGTEVEISGKKYLIIKQSDIMGKFYK